MSLFCLFDCLQRTVKAIVYEASLHCTFGEARVLNSAAGTRQLSFAQMVLYKVLPLLLRS